MKNGISATVIAKNDNYPDDEKDVALLHVDATNLPSLRLSNASAPTVGSPVYIFGYPTSADYNGLNGSPSLTSGTINAFKDSTKYTFKYIQTDAKISQGSSGGPMFDANGSVIGMLTLLSQANDKTGDSFAFAIPVEIIKSVLADASVSTPTQNDYASHFLAGLAFQQAKHCKNANIEFEAAANMTSVFNDPETYMQPYIDACNTLIASGNSIDGAWDAFKNWMRARGSIFWTALAVGLFVIGGLSIGIALLLRRMRGEEKEINSLQKQMETTVHNTPAVEPAAVSTNVSAASPVIQQPAASIAHPELVAYIQQMRASGRKDEETKTDLAGAGWSESDIAQGFGGK